MLNQLMINDIQGVAAFSVDEVNTIGMALIESYGSVNKAARIAKISPARLRWLVRNHPEIGRFHEIGQECVKGLLDEQIIDKLADGDENMVMLITRLMYRGRRNGGFNASEIGVVSYDDPLAKKLSSATEDDTQRAPVINFNFLQADMPSNRKIEKVINATIDIEARDVDDEV
jgi:hypothetical protein